jgi:ubiquinone/menaquinone biosynthesis C-methylase UbiE
MNFFLYFQLIFGKMKRNFNNEENKNEKDNYDNKNKKMKIEEELNNEIEGKLTLKNEIFWNDFFNKEEDFEWYCEFNFIEKHLKKFIKDKNFKILHVGCGSSNFGVDLYNNEYKNIINIDISGIVIEKMQKKHEDKKELIWKQGDISDLKEFGNEEFDTIIEKGVIDSIFFRNKEKESNEIIHKSYKEFYRVLKDGGCLILITMKKKIPLKKKLEELNFEFKPKIKIFIDANVKIKKTEESCKNLYIHPIFKKIKN